MGNCLPGYLLEGEPIRAWAAVRRIGKYWLIDLSNDHVLLGHLGMTGRLVFADAGDARPPHTHAIFHLRRGLELRYVDPRRFM